MAAKPHLRIRSSALAVIATAIGFLAFASASRADTGTVYFDSNGTAAAGGTLFNGSFTGSGNVGLGPTVMPDLSSGGYNVATGTEALLANQTGSFNIATGFGALGSNVSSDGNTAAGDEALADSTGSSNIALGQYAGMNLTTGSNNIYIGNQGDKPGESGVIRIGTKGAQKSAFLAGVNGKSISGPAQPVLVNAKGQLGTTTPVSAKTSAAKPLSATAGRHLVAEVRRLERENRRQEKEIRKLRGQG